MARLPDLLDGRLDRHDRYDRACRDYPGSCWVPLAAPSQSD
jgi:hypothetical protein